MTTKHNWIIDWLKRTSIWNLVWVSLLLSEVFTFLMNSLMGYLWWGEFSLDLILIGAVDAFVVALIVTVVIVFIINAYREAEREMEETRRQIERHQEREDVSFWLHDDIGSDLVNIMLVSEMLQEKNKADGDTAESLGWIGDASRNALNSIRSYLNFSELAGPALKDLVGYMRDYGQVLFDKMNVSFSFTDETSGRPVALPPMKSFSVYLIYKEALTNIVKHAAAANVGVTVSGENGDLVLVIRDDGRGFDPKGRKKGGYGLRSIAYRAETMGGSLTSESANGDGTTVTLTVPSQGPAPIRQRRAAFRPRRTP